MKDNSDLRVIIASKSEDDDDHKFSGNSMRGPDNRKKALNEILVTK